MGAHGLAALIGTDPAVQLGVAAQARQAQGDIGGRAAGDVHGLLPGVDDNVDQRLADDEGGSLAAGCGHGDSFVRDRGPVAVSEVSGRDGEG